MKKSIISKVLVAVCTLIASVMAFSVAACNTNGGGGNKLPSGESHGLTLIAYSMEVDAGTASPLIVVSALMEDVVWTSSDESIATVEVTESDFNMACAVNAHQAGVATITATSGPFWATCTVGVIDPEVILITKGGYIESEVSLAGKGDTVKLSAKSSRNHNIKWETGNELIATVDSKGVVKAQATSGTVEIIARCAQHSNVSSSITVKIGDGVNSSYWLKNSFVDESIAAVSGVWYYWNEFPNVENAKNVEGTISFDAKDLKPGANWYNIELKYAATQADKDVAGKSLVSGQLYALKFKLNITKAGHVTVNRYVLEVQKGEREYTIYYKHGSLDTDKPNLAFVMDFGVDGMGCDLIEENFTVKVSNLSWQVATSIPLTAPSFTIANNEIDITDTNPAGSVGSYTLNLYDAGGAMVRSVLVEDNKPIDLKKVPKGTYTAQIVANSANAHYITSPESKVQSQNTVVSTTEVADLEYDIVYGGEGAALVEAGSWTYWSSTWVGFVTDPHNPEDEDYDGQSGKVLGEKAHVTFTNNAGFWYDTQLWYKTAGKSKGDTYKVKLHLDNLPVVEGGAITVNDHEIEVTESSKTIDLNITETDGASIQILFGKNGQTDDMPLADVTDVLIWLEW